MRGLKFSELNLSCRKFDSLKGKLFAVNVEFQSEKLKISTTVVQLKIILFFCYND